MATKISVASPRHHNSPVKGEFLLLSSQLFSATPSHGDGPRLRRGALFVGGHAILIDALLLIRALLLVLILLPEKGDLRKTPQEHMAGF